MEEKNKVKYEERIRERRENKGNEERIREKCEKVASDLRLGSGFRGVLRFPPPVTTG